MRYTLGFIGAGNMAEAIARAALTQAVVPADRIIAADPSAERRKVFASLGITVTADNAQVVAQAQQIMLAIKPQTLAKIAGDIGPALQPDQILISIMAGISTAKLEAALGKPARLVRVMPNTPMLVGLGMAGIALGAHAQPDDAQLSLALFQAGGQAILVSEDQIDAITAVSGSGPAYLFYLAEAMEHAARELGLAAHARLLVQQTLLGAANLLAQSPDTAAELRRKVTSPGGTTEAALKHLDGNASTAVVINAIKAAEKRARELGA